MLRQSKSESNTKVFDSGFAFAKIIHAMPAKQTYVPISLKSKEV